MKASGPVTSTAGLPDPVGVWEVRGFASFWGLSDPNLLDAGLWAMRHLERLDDICRAEFYLVDSPFAVLWRLARDEDGVLTDVTEGPELQALGELPPAHLLAVPRGRE